MILFIHLSVLQHIPMKLFIERKLYICSHNGHTREHSRLRFQKQLNQQPIQKRHRTSRQKQHNNSNKHSNQALEKNHHSMNVGRQQMDAQDIRVVHKRQQRQHCSQQQHNHNTTTQQRLILKSYIRQSHLNMKQHTPRTHCLQQETKKSFPNSSERS